MSVTPSGVDGNAGTRNLPATSLFGIGLLSTNQLINERLHLAIRFEPAQVVCIDWVLAKPETSKLSTSTPPGLSDGLSDVIPVAISVAL